MRIASRYFSLSSNGFLAIRTLHGSAPSLAAGLFLLIGFVATAVASAPDKWTETAQSMRAQSNPSTMALGDFLDESGNLAVPETFSGAIDPSGYSLRLDDSSAPRFVPKFASESSGDPRWADHFHLPGCNDVVTAIAARADGTVFLGGGFSQCGNQPSRRVAAYNPESKQWLDLDGGLDAPIRALAVSDTALTVGGYDVIDDERTTPLVKWNFDNQTWSAISPNFDDQSRWLEVVDIVVHEGALTVLGFRENQEGTQRAVAQWLNDQWTELPVNFGESRYPKFRKLLSSGGELYVGGDFDEINGSPFNDVARWDSAQAAWVALSGTQTVGVRGKVVSMSGHGDDIFLLGEPDSDTTSEHAYLAHWNQQQADWQPVDSSWQVIDPTEPTPLHIRQPEVVFADHLGVTIGGKFTSSDGWTWTHRLRRWSFQDETWEDLVHVGGTGFDSRLSTLVGHEGQLLFGGHFAWAGGQHSNFVAQWDAGTEEVSPLDGTGSGLSLVLEYGRVKAMVAHEGSVYAGGEFWYAGSKSISNLARWDSTEQSWHPMGNPGIVSALLVVGDYLYVGGGFSSIADSEPFNSIARWHIPTEQWEGLSDNGIAGVAGDNATVSALHSHGDYLYVGGQFQSAGGVDACNIAAWHIQQQSWHTLNTGGACATSGPVRALSSHEDFVFSAGEFESAGGQLANHVAYWDTANLSWHALPGTDGIGTDDSALALHMANDQLFVGGSFSQAGGIPARRIAQWDIHQQTWHRLSDGLGSASANFVAAITGTADELYVGGSFSGPGYTEPRNLAMWNGHTWTDPGRVDREVSTLAYVGPEALYVGGRFTSAGGLESSRIGHFTTRGQLAIEVTGNASGSVSSTEFDIDCADECLYSRPWGRVTLTPEPAPGAALVGWSGNVCSGVGPCTFDYIEDSQVIAEFSAGASLGGTLSGLAEGASVTLLANDHDQLTLEANGAFQFPAPVAVGTDYRITLTSEPEDPAQICTLGNAEGVIREDGNQDVTVECVDAFWVQYSVTNGELLNPEERVKILPGQTATISTKAAQNYALRAVYGCGMDHTYPINEEIAQITVESPPLYGACEAVVAFSEIMRTVTPLPSANGTISPAYPRQVQQGRYLRFDLYPDEGYAATDVESDCGESWELSTPPIMFSGYAETDCEFLVRFTHIIELKLLENPPAPFDQPVTQIVELTNPHLLPESAVVKVKKEADWPNGDYCESNTPTEVEGSKAYFACELVFDDQAGNHQWLVITTEKDGEYLTDPVFGRQLLYKLIFKDRFGSTDESDVGR